METVQIEISNMSCASCVGRIEKALLKLEGIEAANVNFATGSANVDFHSEKVSEERILETLGAIGYPGEIAHKHAEDLIENKTKKEASWLMARLWVSIAISLPFLAYMLSHFLPYEFEIPPLYQAALGSIVQFFGGWPFYVGAFKSLKAKRANMDTLIVLGTTTAYVYSLIVALQEYDQSLYFDTCVMIITLVLLGKVIEKKSKMKAQSGMRALLEMQPKIANLLVDGKSVSVPVEDVKKDDIFTVQAGEKVPVDGEVVKGISTVDESMLTGESIPIEKMEGEKIYAGTVNGNGLLTAKALKVGSETTLSHIIELVEKAQGTKAPVQKLVDKISSIFVPIVLVISVITFVIWAFAFHSIPQAILSSVAVLIIACPCALGLATPIVIMVAAAKGASVGILIKDAKALEEARKIEAIIIDKTGTITEGKPKVVLVKSEDEKDFMKTLVGIAQHSNHPLSKAMVKYAKEKNYPVEDFQDIENIPGKGVRAVREGHEYLLGSVALIKEEGIDDAGFARDFEAQSSTVVILSQDKKCVGFVLLEDPVKEGSHEAILGLKEKGVFTAMLTGDREPVAKKVAQIIEVDAYYAEVLPEHKSEYVEKMKNEGKVTAMVGDGVNDAPALATSDVGFAIAEGTDVAMESASIGLMRSNLKSVLQTLELSRLTTRKVRQNLFFAFFYNSSAIPIAALGFLNPIIAGAAMALSSICVVFNAVLLQKKKI